MQILILVVLVVVLILLASCVKIVPQAYAYVVGVWALIREHGR